MTAPPCRVCRQRTAEYTCPRCNARYCSLDCYRQHSDRCTEGFYRDAAVTELRSIRSDEDERRRMMEILQRLHQQELDGGIEEEEEEGEGSEDEEGRLSADTLHRLLAKMQACGGTLEVSADDLSPAELEAFHRALAAGELSGVVRPWQPWWLTEEAAGLELGAGGTRLMAAVEQQQGEAAEQQQQQQEQHGEGNDSASPAAGLQAGAGLVSVLPEPASRPLPPLAALTKASPSPLLRYQLLDLLYSYCHTMRLYNGDCSCEVEAAADALFALSAVLAAVVSNDGTSQSDGVAPALLGCLQRACLPPLGSRGSREFAVGVLSDVAAILQLGRPVVLTALMDLSRLLEAARQQLEHSSDPGGRSKQHIKEVKRRLLTAERKLLFFMAWANEQPAELYEMLAVAAAAEHQKHAAALATAGSSGRPLAAAPGATPAPGKPITNSAAAQAARPALIEEL